MARVKRAVHSKKHRRATLERAKNPGVLEYIGSLKLKGVPDPIRAYTPR